MTAPRPCIIVLVRHAESLANFTLSQITQGLATSFPLELASLRDADVRLTELGEAQARATGPYLAERFGIFDHCYVSPWARTRQTFERLLEGYPDDQRALLLRRVTYEEQLREHERGALLWVPPAEVAARYPDEAHRRTVEGEYYYRPLGGESWADCTATTRAALCSSSRTAPLSCAAASCCKGWARTRSWRCAKRATRAIPRSACSRTPMSATLARALPRRRTLWRMRTWRTCPR